VTPPEEGTAAGEPSVLAVVVNYNARDELLRCLRSLRREGASELVVVDNGSGDGSKEAVAAEDPGARFLPMGRNLGYGAAANRGFRAGGCDAVLVCNPDVVLRPGALRAMARALWSEERIAVVGPAIENEDGSLYPSARTFPSVGDAAGHAFLSFVSPRNRFSARYKMLDWDHRSGRIVDWVSGACFLARRSALEELGGFDESYFMYLEDVDLCWRAARAGWLVAYAPDARVVHRQGVSADRVPYRMIVAHHRSLLRFAERSTTGWRRLLLPAVALGLAVRAPLAIAQRAARRETPRAATSVQSPPRPPAPAE
jgi:N-acetylglucosaminyl-diphospho-decaprenol L-rhamnosyltransferase